MAEPTIIEVAEEADVSPATVSRVINQSAPVSPEKKKSVKDAVKKLNYKPNKFAHALRKQQSNLVGVVVPNLSNPYFSTLIRGAETYLHEKSKSVLICDTNSKPAQEGEYVNTLLKEQVDGVILVSSGEDSKQLELILEKDIPVVAADRDPHLQMVSKVLVNNRKGGRLAAAHLIQQGYQEFGFVKGPPGISTAISRYEGFKEALREEGAELTDGHTFKGDYTYEGGRKAGRKLLERADNDLPPMGVVAADDLMALGVLWELKNAGVQIPEQFGVVGFDDILMAKLTYPSLSTVSIPAYQIGKEAAKILLDNLERATKDSPLATTEKTFDVEFLPRKSTDFSQSL